MWRPLTGKEIMQLAEEYDVLERWKQVRQFALDVYGVRAYKMEVYTTLPYNDEYHEDAEVESVSVYDKNGKEMVPDFSLPFWREKGYIQGLKPKRRNHELDEAAEEILQEVIQQLPLFHDLHNIPAEHYHNGPDEMCDEYLLDSQPTISFPYVYVNDMEVQQSKAEL